MKNTSTGPRISLKKKKRTKGYHIDAHFTINHVESTDHEVANQNLSPAEWRERSEMHIDKMLSNQGL